MWLFSNHSQALILLASFKSTDEFSIEIEVYNISTLSNTHWMISFLSSNIWLFTLSCFSWAAIFSLVSIP